MADCKVVPVGAKIGRWTVIRESYSVAVQRNKTDKKSYKVRCVCGDEVIRTGRQLAVHQARGTGGCTSKACFNRSKVVVEPLRALDDWLDQQR